MTSQIVDVTRIEPVVGTGIVFVARWFSDADSLTPADPTGVTFRVQLPSVAPNDAAYVYGVDSEVVKNGVGVYEFRYAASEAGLVAFRAEATGAVVDSVEWTVHFRPTVFDATAGP